MAATAHDIASFRRLSQNIRRHAAKMNQLSKRQRGMARTVETQVNRLGYMENIIRLRFLGETSRSTGGQKWKGRTRNYPWPTLRKTSRMFQDAVRAVKGTYSITKKVRFRLNRIGAYYARFHQYGTPRMPARKFFNDPTNAELRPADKLAILLMKRMLKRALS